MNTVEAVRETICGIVIFIVGAIVMFAIVKAVVADGMSKGRGQ